jgi:hypothetical protein
LNLDIVQAIRAAQRQCHVTLQKSSWYSDHLASVCAFLAARRGPREIEHDLERFPFRCRASYIPPPTAATCYDGRICRSHTRNRRRHPWPSAQVPPEKSHTGENNARRSSIQNDSLLSPRTGIRFKPIELSKTFATRAEMIDPRVNFGNRDLMACHACQKLRVRTAGSIWVRESFC